MGTWNRADKDRAADLWAPTLPFLFVVDTLLVRWIKSALIEFNGISSGCLAGIQISLPFHSRSFLYNKHKIPLELFGACAS